MATEIKLPELGEGIDKAEVVNILVSVGDSIDADQPIIEVESEKASLEVPADVAGRVTQIHIKAGDQLTPGQTIISIEENGTAPTVQTDSKTAAKTSAPKVKGTPGNAVTPIESAADPEPEKEEDTAPEPAHPVHAPNRLPVAAAPSTRKFAREIGVDIGNVPGTGPAGLISVENVKDYSRKNVASGPGIQAGPLPDFSKYGEVEFQKISNVRRATAKAMSGSWATVPHVTLFNSADITDIDSLRKRYKGKAEKSGGRLTVTAIILKIAASALKVHPTLNASIDTAKNQIILKKYVHIGVAVDTPRGLVVPVIRNVDSKNIIQLAVELTELSQKARDGKLSVADMQGGTFTLTNLGSLGTTYFTPIVNHPEVGILGVGRAKIEPVYIDDEFQPRLMVPLSLSFDHRLVDGADGARFLQWMVGALEEPLMISLEG